MASRGPGRVSGGEALVRHHRAQARGRARHAGTVPELVRVQRGAMPAAFATDLKRSYSETTKACISLGVRFTLTLGRVARNLRPSGLSQAVLKAPCSLLTTASGVSARTMIEAQTWMTN